MGELGPAREALLAELKSLFHREEADPKDHVEEREILLERFRHFARIRGDLLDLNMRSVTALVSVTGGGEEWTLLPDRSDRSETRDELAWTRWREIRDEFTGKFMNDWKTIADALDNIIDVVTKEMLSLTNRLRKLEELEDE